MKTLSVWKPVRNALRAVAWEIRLSWFVNQFDFFPTEKNLFTSNWYAFAHFKWLRRGDSVYDFLDFRTRELEEWLEIGKGKPRVLYLTGCLLRALHDGRVRQLFIAYLESTGAGENYRPVMAAVWSACRNGEPNGEGTVADESLPMKISRTGWDAPD
ncbi:MAG TPA: hypothetical protein VGR89_16775 [Puia sp.]|nr:hypothetical protein [Puia sp.]